MFVEKPLCLNETELDDIIRAYQGAPEGTTLTVGFNRRFSPFAEKMKRLPGDGPKNIVATMNAGFIPQEVWVHDLEIGGGGSLVRLAILSIYVPSWRARRSWRSA